MLTIEDIILIFLRFEEIASISSDFLIGNDLINSGNFFLS